LFVMDCPYIDMATRIELPPDLVVERSTARTAPPPMFQVVLLNDDYTPMEFVVQVLQKFFSKNQEDAMRIMLQVHHDGRGVCGIYPQDIAATKISLVAQFARARQHPLQCIMEPAPE
jgi:ATP-dependent Clp protease adaptor protein ClpS